MNWFKRTFYYIIFPIILMSGLIGRTANNEEELTVILRAIGDQYLLELGDSTSTILPIEKVDSNHVVKFQRSFEYQPDLLYLATNKIIEKIEVELAFIVEVLQCGDSLVLHSFQVSNSGKEVIAPCRGRVLDEGCYEFHFIEVENNTVSGEIVANPAINWFVILLIAFLLVGLFLMVYFIVRRRSKNKNGDFIQIGQFQFDPKRMILSIKAQTVELSSKESDLLYLFLSNVNQTVERGFILQEVWGDQGDYVGRTLDVFVSRLRKKLEADPSLKILNIRGVGYRFIIE